MNAPSKAMRANQGQPSTSPSGHCQNLSSKIAAPAGSGKKAIGANRDIEISRQDGQSHVSGAIRITSEFFRKALRGLGYPTVNLDSRRIKLPVRLAQSGIFLEGIAITYCPPCLLNLVPTPVWDDYLAIRRKEYCEQGGLGENMFKIMFAGAMTTLQLEANNKLQLPEDHMKYLRLGDREKTVVLVPGEIWVTVMSGKYFQAMFEAARAEADKIAERIGTPILSHDAPKSEQPMPIVSSDFRAKTDDNIG
ncbi:MAG: hypothetical protein L6437_15920, partial [Kiritimatiellae bacterium]|nr:hypothetical protein [Kiritimatiellia bacterium]